MTTATALRATARRLLLDAAGESRGWQVLHSHLDACIALLELERVTGEECGARALLGESFELLRASTAMMPWLYGGAAQAGWAALTYSRVVKAAPPALGAIDAIVIRWVEQFPDDGDVDLPRGLLGLGVYGLAHPSASVQNKIVDGVLRVIGERLERDPAGGGYLRLADTAYRRANKPGEIGHRDLGMAHGNAGVQAFLAAVARGCSGGPSQRATALLAEIAPWLGRQHGLMPGAVFPQSVETRYRSTRSAWCYGDPGMTLSLLMAADALPGPDGDQARELARRTAAAVRRRDQEHMGIHDACLCHGAAGLLYFGVRMAEAYPADGWGSFIERWREDLERRVAAGPLTYLFPTGHAPNRSLLEGDLGVALVLLYSSARVRPLWEELLLTAVPANAGLGV